MGVPCNVTVHQLEHLLHSIIDLCHLCNFCDFVNVSLSDKCEVLHASSMHHVGKKKQLD